MQILHTVTVERLEHIYREREETERDPLFQKWLQELNVGRRWLDKTLMHNAREAMREWDPTRFNTDKIR